MAGMGLPSMFDTKFAMDRQIEEDAQNAGRLPLGGGMLYASSAQGDLNNRDLMRLAGALGGTGDPRIEKQKAIESVMKEFGKQPETAEDYKTVASMFNNLGQYDFAEKAMAMANDITSSVPERKTIQGADGYKYYIDDGSRVLPEVNKPTVTGKSNDYKAYSEMTDNPTPEGFREWYKEFKGGNTTNKTTKQMALANFIKSKPYIDGTKTIMDFEKDFEAAGRAPTSTSITDPTKIAQSNILNDSINDAYQLLLNNPENEGVPLEDLMEDAKVIGSNKFLEDKEITTKGDTSQNVDDFIYWSAKYPEKSDDDIRELIAAGKPTSPQNILLNENRAFNREAITLRQDESRIDMAEAKSNLVKTNAMLNAYTVGAESGWGRKWLLSGNKIAQDFFGLPQTEAVVATEVLESLFKAYTLDRMAKLKGTPSDKDLDTVELAGATLDRSRAANMIIIEFDAFQQQEKIYQGQHMLNWHIDFIKKNGEAPSGAEYDRYLNAFRNRGDATKWIGEEEDRLRLIDPAVYGNNEFNGFDKLANLDLNKTENQIKIEKLIKEEDDEAAAAALLEFNKNRRQ